MIKMDETNIAIIKHLRNGRKSYREIADELGVTENTVRSRVLNLMESGALEITGLVDVEALPGHRTAIIGIKLNTMDLVKKGKEFSKIKGVISVGVVTGRYDLILTVLLKEEYNLLEFFTEEVSKIKDVQSSETFVVYKGYNLKVPYIL
jgi:Lrp/AsnC family transcriptional regulator for asnA, asnC and gidA